MEQEAVAALPVPSTSVVNEADEPGLRGKLGYGAGNVGLQCITFSMTYYLLIFYTDVVGLAPMLIAIAMALPRCLASS